MIRSWKWKILVIVLLGGGIIGVAVSTIEYIQQSVIVLLGGSETQQQSEISTNSNLSEDVLALKSIVEKYAKINGIPDEVPFILAIMMVESGGKGLDPMQSSESAGLAPNAFTSPEQSIKQGVAYYKSCLESAQNLNVTDKKAVIQSYNYGAGFLYWLSKNNKSYSFDAGAEFACQQAEVVRKSFIRTLLQVLEEIGAMLMEICFMLIWFINISKILKVIALKVVLLRTFCQ